MRTRRSLRMLLCGGVIGATVLPLTVLPLTLSAQSLREQTGGRNTPSAVTGPRQVLSINPAVPILGWFQGEYEVAVQDNLAFALSGSSSEFDRVRYNNIDAKLRLYPEERGLQGVGIAAGLGAGTIKRRASWCSGDVVPGAGPCRRTENAASFSVEGHYQWLLGSRRSTAITMGGGVKRYFVGDENDDGINRIMPTLRLTIGYAFR